MARLSGMTSKKSPPVRIARKAAGPTADQWLRLAVPTPDPQRFDPASLSGLPEPARRWLAHAIAPGTLLARTVVLEMEGRFRLGRWLPMRAVQVVSPPLGLVWAAQIGWGPLSFRGFDRYGEDRGEMSWRLFGRLPVVHAEGADVDRSAAGRLAGEVIWVPASFLGPGVSWQSGPESNRGYGRAKDRAPRRPGTVAISMAWR